LHKISLLIQRQINHRIHPVFDDPKHVVDEFDDIGVFRGLLNHIYYKRVEIVDRRAIEADYHGLDEELDLVRVLFVRFYRVSLGKCISKVIKSYSNYDSN